MIPGVILKVSLFHTKTAGLDAKNDGFSVKDDEFSAQDDYGLMCVMDYCGDAASGTQCSIKLPEGVADGERFR